MNAKGKVSKIGKGGKTERGLNTNQEAFCQLYVDYNGEFFGNGVQTYIEVYNPDTTKKNRYKIACSGASEILSNPKVIARINELLEEGGLNDQNVDKQLGFLVSQYSDFSNKLGAIKEYNRLKQRIIDSGATININRDTISTEELKKIISGKQPK